MTRRITLIFSTVGAALLLFVMAMPMGVRGEPKKSLDPLMMVYLKDFVPDLVSDAPHESQTKQRAYRNAQFATLALKGDPHGQMMIGRAYAEGYGVPEDTVKAAKWFRRAAEGGDPTAQALLGAYYAVGRGVPRNYFLAYVWSSIAAASGKEEIAEIAVESQELAAESMTRSQIAKAQKRAGEVWEQIEARMTFQTPVKATENSVLGIPRVIDGDTLDVAGQRVRLQGVDTPESAQKCRDSQGTTYSCGHISAGALRARIGDGPVRCEIEPERGRYGRAIGTCLAMDGTDLNRWLVRNGHGLAYRKYSTKYVRAEEAARTESLGIHAGSFVPPWDWRKGARQ